MTQRGKPSSSRGRSAGMNKTAGLVLVVAILVIGALVVVWMYRPRRTEPLATITCSDGPRLLIEAGKFDTQYWAYSIKLEGTLGSKAKLAAEIEPKQLQQLSEAMQQGNEFRKWLVNSYNACAVTREHYAAYGVSFQGMDNAARNIQEALVRGIHSAADRASLAALVKTYLQLAGNLQQGSR
jgi:hypothetical protein